MNQYSILSKAYDLLDIIYFREKGKNPREVILEMITDEGIHVLDMCCGWRRKGYIRRNLRMCI